MGNDDRRDLIFSTEDAKINLTLYAPYRVQLTVYASYIFAVGTQIMKSDFQTLGLLPGD